MSIDFKGSHYPKDVILYVRYAVSYRDLEEIMAERCVKVDRATLNRWVVIDKSGANFAGLQWVNIGLKFSRTHRPIEILRVKYLNIIVEQDHRFVKKIIGPMMGLKAFHSAVATIKGIEVAHMIRKQQVQSNHTSPFQKLASLAA